MKYRRLLSLAIATSLTSPFPGTSLADAQTPQVPPKIQAVTEKTPITLQSKQHPGGGEATHFVDLVLQQTQLPYNLSFMPWRRGYHHARADKNVLIYPLAKTRSREKNFHWVGKLIPISYYLFKLKRREDVEVNDLESAKKYRIGVVNYHAHHELLISEGFQHLQPVNSSDQNLKKLLLDRIDLFPISGGGAIALCKSTQIDCDQLQPVLKLDDISGGLYMAYSIHSDDEVVRKTADSYRGLLQDGTHQKIFSRRLNSFQKFEQLWNLPR